MLICRESDMEKGDAYKNSGTENVLNFCQNINQKLIQKNTEYKALIKYY